MDSTETTQPAADTPLQADTKPRRVKGTAVYYDTDEFEFHPQGKGEPQRQNVRRAGTSQLYETTGERSPKMVAHLTVPRDSTDPAADLRQELERLIKPMSKKEPPAPRAKALLDNPDLQVYYAKQQKKLTVRMVLDTGNRPAAQMFRMMSEINKIIENQIK